MENKENILKTFFYTMFTKPYEYQAKKDFAEINKIKDKVRQNLIFQSHLQRINEETKINLGNNILAIISIIVITSNLVFLFYNSMITNINPILIYLLEERTKEIGPANMSQQLGINYENITQDYVKLQSQSVYFFYIIPFLVIFAFGAVLAGAITVAFLDHRRKVYINTVKKLLIEYSKN